MTAIFLYFLVSSVSPHVPMFLLFAQIALLSKDKVHSSIFSQLLCNFLTNSSPFPLFRGLTNVFEGITKNSGLFRDVKKTSSTSRFFHYFDLTLSMSNHLEEPLGLEVVGKHGILYTCGSC